MFYFCTYFDKNYLPRGLAVIKSLIDTGHDFKIYILALDSYVLKYFADNYYDQVVCIALVALEAADPELAHSKSNRSLVEYYFTFSPCLPLYLLNTYPDLPSLIYIDSDLFFFSSVSPLMDELGNGSILIIPHRFEKKKKHLEKFGIFNVGFQIYRNTDTTKSILKNWRLQCIDWCYDILEDAKFADQKYLDKWPEIYGNAIMVSKNAGANLAPWNLNTHKLSHTSNVVFVDDTKLIFYHFQRLRFISTRLVTHGLDEYEVKINKIVKNKLYAPYLNILVKLTKSIKVANLIPLRLINKYTYDEYRKLLKYGRTFFSVSKIICLNLQWKKLH